MVCLGNICRSPLAEGLLKSKVSTEKVFVDSAGLDDWHIGEAPCDSSQEIARKNDLDISGLRARKFKMQDFDRFDKIYIMDSYNMQLIRKLTKDKQKLQKVDFILNEVFPDENLDVPDSYQKGRSAAQMIYKMLDMATDKIANNLNHE